MNKFQSTFSYKLIYIFRINDKLHKNLLKIGDTTITTTKGINELIPNCRELNQTAKDRINSYTKTASIPYELLHTELAIKYEEYEGKKVLKAFRDKAVHEVLLRSNIVKHNFNIDNQGIEWFETDLKTAKNAIKAVKNNQKSLNPNDVTENCSPIIFRPEQKKAIKMTITQFKNSDRMLWNAKMRFGKTLSALEVAKENGYKKVLIFTHRPVVSNGWFEDFNKIFYDTTYKFGSKTKGEKIENLVDGDFPFVYFASIQDLRGSVAVGGKFEKNEFIFLIDWDFVIVDEAHEGTQTTLGQRVIQEIIDNTSVKPKLLELSGTPFNLLSDFKQNEIFTWDYIMEQKAKLTWGLDHFGDSNPYEDLPKLEIYTYNLEKTLPGYIDIEDDAFNFREFFRTWTGDVKKDFKQIPNGAKIGDFVHREDVLAFLNLISKSSSENNYPFSTEEYRQYFRHSLWMVPGVKEAKALSKLLKSHPIFSQFNIANVAGEGDEETNYKDALQSVRHAIGENPDDNYSITISCGRLTTGVTVPEWTSVLMLYGSFNTSASSYLQTIFRVQTPANLNGKVKQRCYVFDFAPDRTLKMVAEAGHLSAQTGKISDKTIMGEFLNYCPVIAIEGSNMNPYNPDIMLQQLKRAYTDRVVKNGFDDRHLYNDNLLKLDEIDLKDFENLKRIIGSSKQTKKTNEIGINEQGFTDEQYKELEKIERKPKNERTPEELALLEERKKKRNNAQKAISILRGISIRIPLLIYGSNVKENQEITKDNFVNLIDDVSWDEFMPKGVTKEIYKKFSKYYEEDVFIAAGKQIRNIAKAADELNPTERTQKIAELFSMFKNPDKETVLTPWRVVNMHMGDCLGGYNFYDKNYTNTIEEPRFIDNGQVTKDILLNTNAKILEINSKTGLYPLYVAYSLYRKKFEEIPKEQQTFEKQFEIWKGIVENNIFVICKTPMAKSITQRTLLGYRNGKINAHAFDDLIMQIKDKPEQLIEKITRGNFWNKEIENMKFDAIVGNPPYQENDGGGIGDSATPIYNHFVNVSKEIKPKYFSLIMPARWMKGGKGLAKFRSEMMNDERILKIHDFADAKVCFDHINIDGGVCYFLWDSAHSGALNYIYTDLKNYSFETTRLLVNNLSNTIIRDIRQETIISKVQTLKSKTFNEIVSARNPYGFAADLFNKPERYPFVIFHKNKNASTCKIYGVKGLKGGAKRTNAEINKNIVTKNPNMMQTFNLLFSKAYMVTSTTPPEIILAKPNEICTETFLSIGQFDNENIAMNCLKYIKSKFFRALLYFNRSSLNICSQSFSLVPLQDFTDKSDIDWTKSIPEIDQQLYKKYNLSKEEINFIESMIKPME